MQVYKAGDRLKKETVVAPNPDRAREAAKEATGYEVEQIDLIKKVGDVTVTVTDEWTFRHNDPDWDATGWDTHHNWHPTRSEAKAEIEAKTPERFETETVSRTVRVETAGESDQ